MQKSLKNLLSCSWRWSQRYENLSCLLSLTQNYIKIFSASHEFKEIFQAKRFWCIESVPKHVTITLDQGSFIALCNFFTIFSLFMCNLCIMLEGWKTFHACLKNFILFTLFTAVSDFQQLKTMCWQSFIKNICFYFQHVLKVSKSQKHFFLKLHCPKNERNIRQNSALESRIG